MKSWAMLIILLAATVASAVSLIGLKHQGRQLFIELERESRRHDRHQVEWSRLQIELAWLGETGRIEKQALDRLKMKSPGQVRVLVAENAGGRE